MKKSINRNKIKSFIKTLPNKLTISRLLAIPCLLILYPIDVVLFRFICATIFLVAASTDFFDGYIARKYSAVTPLGKLLDPVADKLLVTTGFVLLVGSGNIYTWLAVVLICRDIFITGLRLIALENNFSVDVNYYGKLKTFFSIITIANLMVVSSKHQVIFSIPFKNIGMILAWITLGLSLYSGYTYWVSFIKNYKISRNDT